VNTAIPVHSNLRGSVTKVSVFVRSQMNSNNSYAFGRVTINKHETPPTSLTAGKPFLGRSTIKNNWSSAFQESSILPLTPGNHLTPTTLKLEAYTTVASTSYKAYVYYVLHYADGSSYKSDTYTTDNNNYTTLVNTAIPVHSNLRGSVTKVSVFVRSQVNSNNSYAYGRVTISGHETKP
jgi:hypothetical protein